MNLYTVGYGLWPTSVRMSRLVETLTGAGVTTLVDIRHAPCSSNINPDSNYGPRDWHLQADSKGIANYLAQAGIQYRWIGELGNPQKHDPQMAILKEQIASEDDQWPVNRGLKIFSPLVQGSDHKCCLLCACKNVQDCHRKIIAEALSERFFAGQLKIMHL